MIGSPPTDTSRLTAELLETVDEMHGLGIMGQGDRDRIAGRHVRAAHLAPADIKHLRKSLGLSPKEFAARLGFTGPHSKVLVHRWETGLRVPGEGTVLRMRGLEREGVL